MKSYERLFQDNNTLFQLHVSSSAQHIITLIMYECALLCSYHLDIM